uniref:hypothetical protein n=1 Tax=Vibrio vulnificus TaxID=672 RepID=UPI001F36F64D
LNGGGFRTSVRHFSLNIHQYRRDFLSLDLKYCLCAHIVVREHILISKGSARKGNKKVEQRWL